MPSVTEKSRKAVAALPALAAAPGRRGPQALIVFEPSLEDQEQGGTQRLPMGWNCTFGNATLSDLYGQLLDEAGIAWAATILPEPGRGALAGLEGLGGRLIACSQHIQIRPEVLNWNEDRDAPCCVVFNARQFPLCDLRLALRVHRRNRCDATFFRLCEHRGKTYDEQVFFGADGRVHRVDRIYRGPAGAGGDPNWPAFVVLSQAAMLQLLNVPLPWRLEQWGPLLLGLGLRLCGSELRGRSFDLHQRGQLDGLAQALLRQKLHWLTRLGPLRQQRPGIWVGKSVKIDRTAQLFGPLVIGDAVEVGAEAVIVGPSTLGRGATIGPGVLVRRSVVLPQTPITLESLGPPEPLRGTSPSRPAAEGGQAGAMPRPARAIRLRTVLETESALPLSSLRPRAYAVAKRAIDIVGALLMIALTLPLFPLIALAIKLNSPGGPIFYGHTRQGRGGRNFQCWKFRTMVPDAEHIKRQLIAHNEVDGPQFKIRDDPRIFRVGRFLRKYNIDEWPQFFNVLLGQMSLVGPRPSPERENHMCPAWREARLSVRPGITGLWQVCRLRQVDTDFQEWIYYDVQYVKTQSLWLDLKILFKTLRVALKGA